MRNTHRDCILSTLTEELLNHVEDQLSNNEVSSDEELHTTFVSNGLTGLQATRALHYRSLYLNNIFLEGHTPIRKGSQALRFNPARQQFELIRD